MSWLFDDIKKVCLKYFIGNEEVGLNFFELYVVVVVVVSIDFSMKDENVLDEEMSKEERDFKNFVDIGVFEFFV